MKKNILLVFLSLMAVAALSQDVASIDRMLWDGEAAEALLKIEESIKQKPPQKIHFELQNKKAEALIRMGRYDEAGQLLQAIRKNMDSTDATYSAAVETNNGFLNMVSGRNDMALESFLKAIAGWEKAGRGNSLEAAQTQAHLGNLFRATGKYTQAEEQLNIALLTRQKLLPETHALIAGSYNDLGLVYSFTDKDKSLSYYEKALALYEQLHGRQHPKIAQATTNIGYLYSQLELFGDAINNFESALAILDNVYTGAHPSKGFVYFNLGSTYEKMKAMTNAREYYEKALQCYQQSYKSKHPDIARAYNALGNLELAENAFEKALAFYQKALQSNVVNFDGVTENQNPHINEYYDGYVLLYSLLYKAQAFEFRYLRKTLRFSDLTQAIQTLHSCDTLIGNLRQEISNEDDKMTLGNIAHEVYTDGVRISMEAALGAWKKKPFYEEAFYFSEKSKAAVLLGALSEANAKSFSGIPVELLDEEKDLKSAIAMCARKLAQKPDVKEEVLLRETAYELHRDYEHFTKRLEKEFPAYFNLKYNSASPAVAHLQERLDDHTLLLSYFIDDKHQRLYVFQVTKKDFSIREASLPKNFDRYITGLRNSLLYSDIKTFTKASGALSSLLLPKHIPKSIQDLVVIPTARLGTIPFETLLTGKTKDEDPFEALPYLVKKYTIRYEFSSGLILQKDKQRRIEKPSILLYAPVSFAADKGLNELPASAAEVKHIAQLFQQKEFSSALFVGPQANEQHVKKEDLSQYAFLHFATHGIVDEENPELSCVYLQAENDQEDGNLYAGEIYNLELNANLVTLSACKTGLGKISKGEGVIGLSRALVYAGANNCMVSFWNVADESTAVFMQDFYKILLEGQKNNLTATLSAAKRNLMQNKKYASPYYWAPFILIGF